MAGGCRNQRRPCRIVTPVRQRFRKLQSDLGFADSLRETCGSLLLYCRSATNRNLMLVLDPGFSIAPSSRFHASGTLMQPMEQQEMDTHTR